MPTSTTILLMILIFGAALLYSSVGHGGGSGYIAAMSLLSIDDAVMKPTALCLNILVASIATFKFYRVGCFSWPLFAPFAVTSIPASYFGGMIMLPGIYYKPMVGVVLLFAAYRLIVTSRLENQGQVQLPKLWCSLLAGAGIGLLSGLTGTGGGIFLSPLLVIMGWAHTKQSAGVSAAFVLVNSVAGLLGLLTDVKDLPAGIPIWGIAALAGGLLGSHLGSRRLGNVGLRRMLALVLVVAGLKLVITSINTSV